MIYSGMAETISSTERRPDIMRRRLIPLMLSLMIMTVFMPAFTFAAGNDISSGYSVLFVNDNDSYTYTGSDIRPEIIVIDDDFWTGEADYLHTYEYYISDSIPDSWRDTYTLPAEKYTVSYPADCINAGNKTITITGRNGYSGSFTADYNIGPKALKLTAEKNADKSVTLSAGEMIDLSGAEVWFYNEDYQLKSSEFTASANEITISADFLESYKGVSLKHKVQVAAGNYYGNASVRSYNISGLAGLGNIRKVYNGKQKTLSGSDLGLNDAKLGADYKVVYGRSSRKAIGRYTYTIKGKGDCVGSLKGSFEIVPKKPSKILYAKKSGSKATVRWKKVTNCSGYQVQLVRYSTAESDMPDYTVYKTAYVKGRSKLSKTFTNAKKSKYTKVRVRAYKLVSGRKIYSAWKYKSF